MGGVFISYRRSDAGGWAGRLNDHLSLRFGSHVVWQDVDDLAVGTDYLPQILENIAAASAVLIVIGPHWLKDGRKRLADRTDTLRVEIVHALKSTAAVIPTLVGGASMPSRDALPRALAGLVRRNGIALNDADWLRSMDLLFERLQDIVRVNTSREPLGDLHDALMALQSRYISSVETDPAGALTIARDALRVLDTQMPSYPYDHSLQIFRGYFLKNEAMSARDLGDQATFERSLEAASRAFETMRREGELSLANVYNGVGGVTALEGRLEQSIAWFDKALALVPEHSYAQQDRAQAIRFLEMEKKKRRHR